MLTDQGLRTLPSACFPNYGSLNVPNNMVPNTTNSTSIYPKLEPNKSEVNPRYANNNNNSMMNNEKGGVTQNDTKSSYGSNYYGNEEFLNFGDYKFKTVYEVANLGDHKYLEDLLKWKKLNPNMVKHIETVLYNQGQGNWIAKEKIENEEKNSVWVHYEKVDYNGNVIGEGPNILQQKCIGCKKNKDQSQFQSQQGGLCNTCVKNCQKENETNQKFRFNQYGNRGFIYNPSNKPVYK